MREPQRELTFPEIALIAITRVTLGVGAGLLLAGRLGEARRPVGWSLLLVGIITTVPLAFDVLNSLRSEAVDTDEEASPPLTLAAS